MPDGVRNKFRNEEKTFHLLQITPRWAEPTLDSYGVLLRAIAPRKSYCLPTNHTVGVRDSTVHQVVEQ